MDMVVGPIYGIRCWRHRDGRLSPLTSFEGPFTGRSALCQRRWLPAPPDREPTIEQLHMFAPEYHCTCGYHSFRPSADIAGQFLGITAPYRLYAVVELRGRVIEHEHGYRSEYIIPRFGYATEYYGDRSVDVAFDFPVMACEASRFTHSYFENEVVGGLRQWIIDHG